MDDVALRESTKLEARKKIFALENELRAYPQRELPLVHRFLKGVYAREIFMPKDTLAVGKIHRYECLNIISQGDVTVLTETGAQRLTAPHSWVSAPGTKRIVYTNEDTVWTTIHPTATDATSEADLGKLEEELVLKSYDDALPTQEEILLLTEK